jgi:hypothetical protein
MNDELESICNEAAVAYPRFWPSILDAGIEETHPRSWRFPFKIEYLFVLSRVGGTRDENNGF